MLGLRSCKDSDDIRAKAFSRNVSAVKKGHSGLILSMTE